MIAPATLTVSALCARFSAHAADYCRKPSGRETRERQNCEHAMAAAIAVDASMPVAALSPTWLRQVMVDRGLARTTINARVNRVRRVVKWAVSHELVPASVLLGLQAVEPLKRGRCQAVEAPGVSPVDEGVIAATAAAVRCPIGAMIRVQALTGMRSGELVGMRGDLIEHLDDVWIYRPAEHKTDHHGISRAIPLGPRCQAVLEPLLAKLRSDPMLFPGLELSRPLFRNGRGRPWTPGTYRMAVRRGCARAGVEPWTPLQLRHTAATRIRRVVGLDAARTVLGHAKAATTEIYAEADFQSAIDAMKLLG